MSLTKFSLSACDMSVMGLSVCPNSDFMYILRRIKAEEVDNPGGPVIKSGGYISYELSGTKLKEMNVFGWPILCARLSS